MRITVYHIIAALISFCVMAPGAPVVAADQALVLAVHPYLPLPEIQERFGPFAAYLSDQLGRQIQIRVGGNYDEHIKAIGENKVDIAFMGPAPYINVVERYGEKPLLARFEVAGNPKLFGVIAVRANSSFSSLTELVNKRFAFGDPESTMSHIVPRYMLIAAGIPKGSPGTYHFLGSHKNVALGILAGDYDAGAMKKEVFDEFEAKGLRAIAITPGVPDHLFVARENLPAEDIMKLRQAMLQLAGKPGGAEILKRMHPKLTALVPVKNTDYDELREMIKAVNAVLRRSEK